MPKEERMVADASMENKNSKNDSILQKTSKQGAAIGMKSSTRLDNGNIFKSFLVTNQVPSPRKLEK